MLHNLGGLLPFANLSIRKLCILVESVGLDKMCMGHVPLHSHMCEYYNIAKKQVRPLEGISVTHTAREEKRGVRKLI